MDLEIKEEESVIIKQVPSFEFEDDGFDDQSQAAYRVVTLEAIK